MKMSVYLNKMKFYSIKVLPKFYEKTYFPYNGTSQTGGTLGFSLVQLVE